MCLKGYQDKYTYTVGDPMLLIEIQNMPRQCHRFSL